MYHTTKTAKIKRRWYYAGLHWHNGDVLQINVTFFFMFAVLVVW